MAWFEKIYVDMDGVLANFDLHFQDLTGYKSPEFEKEFGSIRFWEKVYEHPRFFSTMPPFKNYMDIIEACKEVTSTVVILSSPSRINTPLCVKQKRKWVDKYLGKDFPAIFDSDKHKFAAENRLLIDDQSAKIEKWEQHGGAGYQYTSFENFKSFLERS